MAAALDDLNVAICVFDEADRALLWNRSFTHFFPEHAGHVHVGEPYRENLRRYYQGRLGPDKLPDIERYIDDAMARHRAQQRPFTFEHGGRTLCVASLPLPAGGRLRLWRASSNRLRGAGADGVESVAASASALSLGDLALFDYVAAGVRVSDRDGRIAWVNGAFVATYGLKHPVSIVGARFEDIYQQAWEGTDARERAPFHEGLAMLSERMRFAGAPFEVPLPGGRWCRIIEQRNLQGVSFFTHVEVTALRRQQQQLELAERRARDSEALLREKSNVLEATLQRMEQGIMMVNQQRVVEVCNRRAIELLGLPVELMASKPSFAAVLAYQWSTDEFVHTPEHLQEFVRAGGILDRPHSYDRKRPDGRVIEVHSIPIEGGGVLRTYTDITERRRNEERIRHVARHDGLTSLVNRDVFLEHLAGALAAARPGDAGFAVHYLDLNRFKPVNDRLGHAVGDKVLALVAQRIRSVARDADVVARMGGDEFAILQFRADGPLAAQGLAQRILDGVAQPMAVEGHVLQVGVSIGIAFHPRDGTDADNLLRNADQAMYRAKALGQDSYCLFDDAQP